MSRRVRRLLVSPVPTPVQLVLGLEGGVLAALGKNSRSGRRYVPGGSFNGNKSAKAA